jgi:hypothetical protein
MSKNRLLGLINNMGDIVSQTNSHDKYNTNRQMLSYKHEVNYES